MGTFISILIFITAVLLILIVLVQNPKGGLAANFSSSNQVMGVRKTSDFLEKATWTLGVALVVLSIISSSFSKPDIPQVEEEQSELLNEVEALPDQVPALPAPVTGGQPEIPQGEQKEPVE